MLSQRIREQLADSNMRKGDLLRLRGKPEDAARAYRHAVSINPGEISARFNLAETLAELERWKPAAESYRQALELDPDYTPASRGAATALLRSGDHARLLEEDFDVENTGSGFFELYCFLGDEFLKRSAFEDAIAVLRRAERISPANWQLQLKLGNVLLKTGELETAANAFKKAIESNPGYSWAWAGLGDSCLLQRHWKAAAQAFRQACACDPAYHWHHFKQAESLAQLGRWDEAAEAYEQCYRIDPELPGLSRRRQEVAFYQQQWSDLEHFCQAGAASESHLESWAENDDPLSILLIAAQPPCPPTGGAIRIQQQIKYLGARHRLVVVCFHDLEYQAEIRQLLKRHCNFAYLAKPGGSLDKLSADIPQSVKYLTTYDCRNVLLRLRELEFDLVLFDFIHSAEYVELFADRCTILQEHNIESEILRQMTELDRGGGDAASAPERATLATGYREMHDYETRQWPRFDLRTVTSAFDRRKMSERCAGETLVVANGVDTGEILPVVWNPEGPLLFIGHLSYAPNVDAAINFVEAILPLLIETDPAIRILLAGRSPAKPVLHLAENPRVEIVADPPDMQAVADHCSMTIVPLRMGSGTRLKILESFAMALPVVSTCLGCEGLDLADGEHLLVADTPADFAEAILCLRADVDLAMRLRANGRRLAKKDYDWQGIFADFETDISTRLAARAVSL